MKKIIQQLQNIALDDEFLLSKRSIEVRFWLLDSFGFYTDDINELKF